MAEGLLARFDAVAYLAPVLAPHATVVLVAGAVGDAPPVTDRGAQRQAPGGLALRSLVRLLVEAVLADHGRDDVRATVVDGAWHPAEVAAVARRRTGVSPPPRR